MLMGHGDLPRYREGNVGCLALGVVVNPLWGGLRHIHLDLDRMAAKVALHPELELTGTAQAVRSARARDRIGVFAGLEGAHGLGERVDVLPELREKGLRYVGFVHFTKNRYARPMVGWGADPAAPLTALGEKLVDACNDTRIVIDVAHLNRRGVEQVCARSKAPVICSHTACNVIHRSPRGLDDDQVAQIARTGGVVGVIFATAFIGPKGLEGVVDHLDHLKRTAGIRHVGVGTDWEGFTTYPGDLDSADKLPLLTEALLRRGWSADDVHAAYGGNFLRVMEEVCG